MKRVPASVYLLHLVRRRGASVSIAGYAMNHRYPYLIQADAFITRTTLSGVREFLTPKIIDRKANP